MIIAHTHLIARQTTANEAADGVVAHLRAIAVVDAAFVDIRATTRAKARANLAATCQFDFLTIKWNIRNTDLTEARQALAREAARRVGACCIRRASAVAHQALVDVRGAVCASPPKCAVAGVRLASAAATSK